MIQIFSKDNVLLKEINVSDKSYRLKEVMGENTLYLYYELPYYCKFALGSYVIFRGEKYIFRKAEDFTKQHSRNWRYTLKLKSHNADTAGVIYKFFAGSFKRFKLDFPLTLKPLGFIKLLVDNLNLADGGWSIGNVLDADEKTLLFDNESCSEALAKIAKAFNTEYEIVNKKIHLQKVEKIDSTALPLSYGKNSGLKPGVRHKGADKSIPINRLYVVGTERNIDGEKYGSPTLLLPKSKEITYMGVTYITDSEGIYIERKDLTGARVENIIDLTHIYPSRVGTVSNVFAVDADKHFYDIEDNTIPADLNYKEYIIPGQEMLLVFQNGALAGIEFKVNYNHESKRFELQPKEEYGLTYPTAPDLPAVGDKYAIFQIQLPDSYIETASNKMLEEAAKALWEGEQEQSIVTGTLDEVFATKNWEEIKDKIQLGQLVSLSDLDFMQEPTLLRIVSVKEYINNTKVPYIELANRVEFRSFSQALAEMKADARSKAYDTALKNNEKLKDLFLYKNAPDVAKAQIKFLEQSVFKNGFKSEVFVPGMFGEGFELRKKAGTQNQFVLELQDLIVNGEMDVNKIVVKKWEHVGAGHIFSAAGFKIDKVEELIDRYRVYPKNVEENDFVKLDQVFCQSFSTDASSSAIKKYWMLVIDVAEDRSYIELSKTDRDGEGVPAVGDDIIQLGYRGTNNNRKGAIIMSSYGDNAPYFQSLRGIDSFDLSGKTQVLIGNETIFRVDKFEVKSGGNFYRVPAEKGVWNPGTYNYYDRVSHDGSLWLCVAQPDTTEEPSNDSAAWQEQVAKGGRVVNLVKNGMFSDGFDHWEINKRLNGEGEVTSEGFVPDFAQGVKFIGASLVQRRGFVKMHGKYTISFMLGQRIKHITRISIYVSGSDLTNKDVYCDWEGLRMVSFSFNYERPVKYFFLAIGWENGVEAFITDVRVTKMDKDVERLSDEIQARVGEDVKKVDSEIRTALLNTGINIYNEEITLIADTTKILSRTGEKIAMFTTENEKPMLLAENIQFEGASTKDGNFKVLDDGCIAATNALLKGYAWVERGFVGGVSLAGGVLEARDVDEHRKPKEMTISPKHIKLHEEEDLGMNLRFSTSVLTNKSLNISDLGGSVSDGGYYYETKLTKKRLIFLKKNINGVIVDSRSYGF